MKGCIVVLGLAAVVGLGLAVAPADAAVALKPANPAAFAATIQAEPIHWRRHRHHRRGIFIIVPSYRTYAYRRWY